MSANKVLFWGFKTKKAGKMKEERVEQYKVLTFLTQKPFYQLRGGFAELQNAFGHHQHSPFVTVDLH